LKEPRQVNIGLDGVARSQKRDEELAKTYASCFSTASGEVVLKHLRALTIETVHGPNADTNAVMHAEGQRYAIAMIQRYITKGRESK
jgi:hypothetical protein